MQTNIHMILASACSLAFCPIALADFYFTEKDGSLQLLDGETLVTAFRTDYRVPYLYPLTSPSGTNILRHWPMEDDKKTEDRDHPHHRGLWLSHGDVNGFDFWTDHDKANASIALNSITEKKVIGDSATFTADLTWIAEDKKLLQESRTHTFSRPDTETLRIDIVSTMTALVDQVVFGDTKEGTFAIRTDRTLRVTGPEAKATLTNSSGETNLDAWGKRATWVTYSGLDEKGEAVVVAIIDNPTSFRHPTHWMARDYGLLAANPFGIHAFEPSKDKTAGNHTLKKGESIIFNYTVVIHNGSLKSAKLEEIYKSLPTTLKPVK